MHEGHQIPVCAPSNHFMSEGDLGAYKVHAPSPSDELVFEERSNTHGQR